MKRKEKRKEKRKHTGRAGGCEWQYRGFELAATSLSVWAEFLFRHHRSTRDGQTQSLSLCCLLLAARCLLLAVWLPLSGVKQRRKEKASGKNKKNKNKNKNKSNKSALRSSPHSLLHSHQMCNPINAHLLLVARRWPPLPLANGRW